jgi:hypothetical protein
MEIVCGGVAYVASLSDGVLGAVLGAVLGSGITLLGVWRQNKNSRKLFSDQLGHEKTQAAEARAHETNRQHNERLFNSRKEVFFAASAWGQATINSICALMSPKVTTAAAANMLDPYANTMAQIEMVAAPETIRAAHELLEGYQKAFSDFLVPRLTVDDFRKRVAAYEQQLEKAKETPQWERLNREHGEAVRVKNDAQLELVRGTYGAAEKQIHKLAALNIAMRKELGFAFDEAEYLKIIEAMCEGVRDTVRRLEEQGVN